VGCFHNPAGVKYLDPTRTTAGREITPATNNTANRAGAQVGGTANTTYEGTGGAVPGSNYSGLAGGLAGEDICLLGDLSITKTAPATVTAGQTLSYTLTPRNNGRAIRDLTFAADQATPATNSDAASRVLANGVVRVIDTLPAGVTVTTALAPAGWTCTAIGQTVTCDSSTPVPMAASTTLPLITGTVLVTSAACSGPIVNTATIAGFQAPYSDTTPANNTATASTTLNCNANLSVTKTNGVGTVTAGGTTSYTVTFANAGPASADNATVRDVAGAGLSCSVASCAATGGTPVASCPATPANLLSGGGVTLPGFPSGGTITFVVNCDVTATGQ
jgi:trimeric autotransporter adhesin